MASFLWLEGIDFGEFIDDTNDISIIRGGSLALLQTGPTALKILQAQPGQETSELVFSGASLALFRLPVDVEVARKAAQTLLAALFTSGAAPDEHKPVPPFAHLRFVTGVAADDGTAGAVRRAHAEARMAQMTGDYPRRPLASAKHMCAFTRRLPADATIRLSLGQVDRLNEGRKADSSHEARVSTSAKARRFYGRQARKSIFNDLMNIEAVKDWQFTSDLHEMIALPSAPAVGENPCKLPMSVEGKLAVFYADGNGFNDIRNKLGGTAEALAKFSNHVKTLMEKEIIGGILGEMVERSRSGHRARFSSAVHTVGMGDEEEEIRRVGEQDLRLRFELLLYGGDEICFIVPAWLGLDVAKLFFEKISGQVIEYDGGKQHPLHFKAGLVFVPYKMPVAASRRLVKALAEEAKLDEQSSVGVHAFESIEPPANGLAGIRRALFGDPDGADGGNAASFAKERLAIPGEKVSKLIEDLCTLKAGGFPRSQIYRALKKAQWAPVIQDEVEQVRHWPAGLGSGPANDKAKKTFEDYKGEEINTEHWHRAEKYLTGEDTALQAWLLSHLWDYADPFGLDAAIANADEAA